MVCGCDLLPCGSRLSLVVASGIIVVADAVRACVPATDSLARWGGDEFLVFGVGEALDDGALHDRIIEHLRTTA